MVLKNHLTTPPFDVLLQSQLDEARRELGADWLGVGELGLQGEARWLAVSGRPQLAQPPLELSLFERLSSPGVTTHLEREGAAALTEEPFGVVIALEVRPRSTPHADACLVVAPRLGADSPVLAELRAILEAGLSAQRGARLARVALAAFDHAADPIELSDRDGRLFYVNAAWERFTGYERASALGSTAGRLFRDPESSPHDPHFYRFAMAELHAGRPWLGAISGKVAGGRRVFAEAHVAPFEVPDEDVKAHVAIRRDLSSRSGRDLALLAAHREFRSVLTAITDGVCVLREGRVYFTNPAFSRILGLPEEALSGSSFIELIHPEDREHFERGHRTDVSRVRALREGGSARFVEISSAGEVSFDGQPATILLVRDTTDYRLAQEELSRAEKLSALGSLAAGVAHEINNPLAYVALNLDVLERNGKGALGEVERDALTEAIEGVARMREIASELHSFSGRDDPGPPGPVDLSRVVSSALNLVNNAIRQRATLVRELTPGLFVLGREGQLVQVLVNLLVNAVQAVPSPSDTAHTITVTTRSIGTGRVEVVVRDTGAGVPDQLLPKLFDPFMTSKKRGEGSGLGLAICKRILDGLGGTIRVDSVLGHGTTVTVGLVEAERGSRPLRASTPAPVPLPPLRILVVEDELPIARALARLLGGHHITRVGDGNAALALLDSGADYDCVLCDLMIPGVSGASVYRHVALRSPALARRFVLMTGGAITPDCREFLESFAGEVLWKPFTPEAVYGCLATVRRERERTAG